MLSNRLTATPPADLVALAGFFFVVAAHPKELFSFCKVGPTLGYLMLETQPTKTSMTCSKVHTRTWMIL
jgi:hypothetical protein